jgi:small subunit ribosomal protein S1
MHRACVLVFCLQSPLVTLAGEDDYARLPALLAGARAALVVSHMVDQRYPLLPGVLPDADGVLRARWLAE